MLRKERKNRQGGWGPMRRGLLGGGGKLGPRSCSYRLGQAVDGRRCLQRLLGAVQCTACHALPFQLTDG